MSVFQWPSPKQVFYQRCKQTWIWGFSQDLWIQRVDERLKELEQWSGCFPRVLIFLSNPLEFLAAYMACAMLQCPVFLGNPAWTQQEREQAQAIADPHLIWSDQGTDVFPTATPNPTALGWIMVPTGGTSGQIKFAIHTWKTLGAAVSGMQQFFFRAESTPIHSCCVLPLYHVSGLMQFMRSLLTGGMLTIIPFQVFWEGISPHPDLASFLSPRSRLNQEFFLSLVPTQLSRLLKRTNREQLAWLAQFNCILLGGAPALSQLLNQARQYHLNLAPTYGMTETGAQVMTLRPEQFRQGQLPPGEILPHIRLNLRASSSQKGQMQWSGPSVCFGYYPQVVPDQIFLADDIAERSDTGGLHLKGRASRKIISGGENIYPEELESVLLAMTEIEDACVFGMPDSDWGEMTIAAYVTSEESLSITDLTLRMKASLASYKCPKVWWRSPFIPRNAQGKIELKRLMETWLASSSTSICNTKDVNEEGAD